LKFDIFIVSNGFTSLQDNHCCYSTWFENSYIILLLYVDDILIDVSNMKEFVNVKARLVEEF